MHLHFRQELKRGAGSKLSETLGVTVELHLSALENAPRDEFLARKLIEVQLYSKHLSSYASFPA